MFYQIQCILLWLIRMDFGDPLEIELRLLIEMGFIYFYYVFEVVYLMIFFYQALARKKIYTYKSYIHNTYHSIIHGLGIRHAYHTVVYNSKIYSLKSDILVSSCTHLFFAPNKYLHNFVFTEILLFASSWIAISIVINFHWDESNEKMIPGWINELCACTLNSCL